MARTRPMGWGGIEPMQILPEGIAGAVSSLASVLANDIWRQFRWSGSKAVANYAIKQIKNQTGTGPTPKNITKSRMYAPGGFQSSFQSAQNYPRWTGHTSRPWRGKIRKTYKKSYRRTYKKKYKKTYKKSYRKKKYSRRYKY